MSASVPAPTSVEKLKSEIVRRHSELSKRLQQIARYLLDHPNEVGLETLAVIADRCDVQPSAIVRFAKTFGFEGASQMQKLLRDNLLSQNAALGYSERARQLNALANVESVDARGLLAEFVEGNMLALANLLETTSAAEIDSVVRQLAAAGTVYVVGYRRSFPVASYLAYSLLQSGKRVIFMDGIAGLTSRQAENMQSDDLLIAVSFSPYSPETIEIVEMAASRGAKLVAITDSAVSPIAKAAAIALQVRDSEVRGFRSLAASLCLAQAIVIAFAFGTSSTSRM